MLSTVRALTWSQLISRLPRRPGPLRLFLRAATGFEVVVLHHLFGLFHQNVSTLGLLQQSDSVISPAPFRFLEVPDPSYLGYIILDALGGCVPKTPLSSTPSHHQFSSSEPRRPHVRIFNLGDRQIRHNWVPLTARCRSWGQKGNIS